jgi:hypothetical protein
MSVSNYNSIDSRVLYLNDTVTPAVRVLTACAMFVF